MEHFEEGPPSFEAVDGEGTVELESEVDLSLKSLLLQGEVVIGDPAIEAAFTDSGFREAGEVVSQGREPSGRIILHFPRMEAEGGSDKIRMALGEFGDGGPILWVGAIDDAVDDAGRFHLGDDVLAMALEAGVGEMVMCVDQQGW